jgi:hypothetical protein
VIRLIRVAVAGGWRSGTSDRGRSLLLVFCVALLTTIAAAFIAVGNARDKAIERVASRGYAVAGEGDTIAYDRFVGFDVAPDGSQIVIVTWHLAMPGPAPAGFPPGATPDVFYVSPALADLANRSSIIGARFAGFQRLDHRFVGQADELLAYRLSDTSERMNEHLSGRSGFEGVGEVTLPERAATIAPTILLLLVPGTGLVWAGATAPSHRLRRRLDVLDLVGASRRQLTGVVLAFALAVVLPGALVGIGAWWIVNQRLGTIPLTTLQVRRGDLATSGLQSFGIVAGVVVAYTLVLARATLARRIVAPRSNSLLSMVAVGGIGLVAAPIVGGKFGFATLLGAVGTIMFGAAAIVEALYRALGARLASRPTWRSVIVGRRLTSAASGSARSQVAWLGLLILIPIVGTWIKMVRTPDSHDTQNISVVQLGGDDVMEVRRSLEVAAGSAAAQVAVERTDVDDPGEPHRRLIADCDRLPRTIVDRCSASGAFELTPDGRRALGRFDPTASSRVPDGFDLDSASLLFFDTTDGVIETTLRAFAARTPGFSVNSELTFRQRESPLIPLVLAALAATTITTALGLALSLAGQAARSARSRRNLVLIGASGPTIAGIAAIEAMIVIGLAAVAAVPLIGVSLWSMTRVDPSATISGPAVAGTLVAMLGGTALVGVAAAVATRNGPDVTE